MLFFPRFSQNFKAIGSATCYRVGKLQQGAERLFVSMLKSKKDDFHREPQADSLTALMPDYPIGI